MEIQDFRKFSRLFFENIFCHRKKTFSPKKKYFLNTHHLWRILPKYEVLTPNRLGGTIFQNFIFGIFSGSGGKSSLRILGVINLEVTYCRDRRRKSIWSFWLQNSRFFTCVCGGRSPRRMHRFPSVQKLWTDMGSYRMILWTKTDFRFSAFRYSLQRRQKLKK